ncbi:rRNA maturation RNase YbeY [Candidatus Parcubacteria bacterium]|nr:rRNA maturation RNase YbeY [Candidatus Parcubacteria bacterium]
MGTSLVISSTVHIYPQHLPFSAIKEAILGKKYELSLTFIGEKRAVSLNQAHRNKSYVPNVLSFPLTTTVGEIFICPAVAKNEATSFSLSTNGYVAYLFIHGCLHLKGHDHGDTMEKMERKYLKAFAIS